ncbi:MAG: iron-containing alcohol dehydrogenase [Tissierellales bacterium]|nr:iron-containing alcohol dehydrogenase [Tissierellales bacterium]
MNNFSIYLPTKIKFGKGTINKLSKLVKGNYKKVLIHYGGGSIKRSGLYDEVINELKKADVEIYELGGVKPNPRLSLVREGIELAKKEGIDLILAVGGGSAIDSAKAIALGAVTDEDVWDFYLGKIRPERALPVGVVLTYPATGSEASMGSVITNEEEGLKLSVNDDLIRPTFAIMDPTYTLTLPRDLTFAGISDILSHVLERYFTNTPNVDLTDHLCEATMKSVIKNARILNENLDDYNARAEIMLAGTIAHNGILGVGREEDWSSHNIGHQLSALYGTTHGVTLSIIFPAWMKYVYKDNLDRFNKFAVNVFDISDAGMSKDIVALEGIKAYEDFLKEVGLPTSFKEANLPSDRIEEMAHKAVIKGKLGGLKKLDVEDIIKIYELAL